MPDAIPEKMTKPERLNYMYGVDALRMIENDIHNTLVAHRSMPAAWHDIWKDEDRRDARRTRVTMRMDADVVKFFKAMGPGYQERINRILRTFMHFRLAKVIEGPDTSDYVLRPEELLERSKLRIDWGDSETRLRR